VQRIKKTIHNRFGGTCANDTTLERVRFVVVRDGRLDRCSGRERLVINTPCVAAGTSPHQSKELNDALADGWVVEMGRSTCTRLVTCVGTRLAGCVVLRNKCLFHHSS
jgi:hypothetical protein